MFQMGKALARGCVMVISTRSTRDHSCEPSSIQTIQVKSTRIANPINPSQHGFMILMLWIRQGSQKPRVAARAANVIRRAGVFAGGANG